MWKWVNSFIRGKKEFSEDSTTEELKDKGGQKEIIISLHDPYEVSNSSLGYGRNEPYPTFFPGQSQECFNENDFVLLSTHHPELNKYLDSFPFIISWNEKHSSWILSYIQDKKVDVVLINPSQCIYNFFKECCSFVFTNDSIPKNEKNILKFKKYNLFGCVPVFLGLCHQKGYLYFENEKILFPLNLSIQDKTTIVKKLKIKLILNSDGTVETPLETLYNYVLS